MKPEMEKQASELYERGLRVAARSSGKEARKIAAEFWQEALTLYRKADNLEKAGEIEAQLLNFYKEKLAKVPEEKAPRVNIVGKFKIFDYLEGHKTAAIIIVAVLLLMLGVVIQRKPALTPAQASPASPMQLAALQLNTLTMSMGVVLEGKGTVVSVEPGSPAERAGIQPGDLINRINGR